MTLNKFFRNVGKVFSFSKGHTEDNATDFFRQDFLCRNFFRSTTSNDFNRKGSIFFRGGVTKTFGRGINKRLKSSVFVEPEGFVGRLPQPQQADEDVLLGILVRQERLPALVGEVVATDQLHLEPEHVAVDRDCALGRYSQETWKR